MMKQRGFSLVEFIVIIVIIGIIASICIPLIMESGDAVILQVRRREISESARIAIDRMSREIRRVRNRTSVLTATASVFQFIDSSNNTITYDLSAGSLRRTQATANNLADNVSALAFTYYDANGNTLASPTLNPTNIRRIQIDLTINFSGQAIFIRGQVTPRRLQ